MASPCLSCFRQGCTEGGGIERLRPMATCIWSSHSSVFKDCQSSSCQSRGCVSIPGGFTFRVHEFVLQAIKALDSGLDFSWQQRISIHHLYADILNVMETFTLRLSIPPTLPFFASPTECRGTSGIPFAAYVERDCRAIDIQINHFQSITFSHRLVKSCSFEELRLADYEEARRYREGDWQVSASSSLLSLVMDTLTKTTHRLASAEEAISRLQSENATLKMSAVTTMDLLLVQRDLDKLRFQISTSDYDVKKGKSSPSWSLKFGSASSGSFLGQGIKPFQLTPNFNTPSPFGVVSNIAAASPAFNNFSKFGEAPNAFATTPASTAPAVFNFNQKTPSTPVAQNPPSSTSSPT